MVRRIGALPSPAVLLIWIVLALAPAPLAASFEGWAMAVKYALTLAMGLFWSAWLWAIYTRAKILGEKSGLGIAWSFVAMAPSLLLLTLLGIGGPLQGAPKLIADLLGLAFVAALFTSLWRTAEALEAMFAVGSKPPWPKVLSTTVLLMMVYVSPFIAANKFREAAVKAA